MRHGLLLCVTLWTAAGGPILAQDPPRPAASAVVGMNDARAILRRWVGAWHPGSSTRRPGTMTVSFAITGDSGGSFHIVLSPDGSGEVRRGAAPGTVLTFETDLALLRRLDRGELSALSAMSEGPSGEPPQLRLVVPEGSGSTSEARAVLMRRVSRSVAFVTGAVRVSGQDEPLRFQAADGGYDARTILERLAARWSARMNARPPDTTTISLLVTGEGGGSFQVVVPRDMPAILREGGTRHAYPEYAIEMAYLRRLDSALTALGAWRSGNPLR